ncbi:unnamed protein product, partial [Mesorhabditis belari]|uniref:Uncharacterized protein n=1 Tax=Mesorhabditis belari TaxID=2138241 RepID=A0AAF3FQM4_9BILA
MPKITDIKSQNGKEQPNSCADAMFGRKTQKYALYFIIFFLACLTIRDLAELLNDYMDNPKQSDLSIRMNDSMTLPNITFCMGADMVNSHVIIDRTANVTEWDIFVEEQLEEMSNKSVALNPLRRWDDRLLFESYDYLAVMNSLERETDAKNIGKPIFRYRYFPQLAAKRKMYQKWQAWMDKAEISYAELMQQVGTQLFLRSILTFKRHIFDDYHPFIMPKLKIQWLSLKQMCFSPVYPKESYHNIEDQGQFFTMLMQTNVDNVLKQGKTIDCMHVDFHGRQSSLNRFMEGKARTRDGFIDQACIGQHHQLTVEVKHRFKHLENDDNSTRCKEMKDGDDTEFDCYSRCRFELIRDTWKCLPLTLSYLAKESDLQNYKPCNYAQVNLTKEEALAGNYSKQENECRSYCRPDCIQIRYNLVHMPQGKAPRANFTSIEIHWGAFEFLNMEQSYVWTFWKLVAAIGGGIGVWLGLSVLSLIQGVGYLYNSFVQKVVVDKKPLLDEEGSAPGSRRGSKAGMTLSSNPLTNPWNENEQRKRSKGDNGNAVNSNPNAKNGYPTQPSPQTKISIG